MKSEKKYKLPAVYDSLDAPVSVWNKIHSTNDLSWLLVKRKKLNAKLIGALSKVWEKIYNEYIFEFGFSETIISMSEKKKEIALLISEYVLTNDRTLLTWIELAELELKEMTGAVSKNNFMQSVMAIEKKFHFQIDENKTSIRKFYTYLKELR